MLAKSGRQLKVVGEKRERWSKCNAWGPTRQEKRDLATMLVFRVFTKRFLEFSDPGYQKNSAGGTVPMEVQRWEKERSGNPGFAVFRIIREELVQKIQMKGWGKRDPATWFSCSTNMWAWKALILIKEEFRKSRFCCNFAMVFAMFCSPPDSWKGECKWWKWEKEGSGGTWFSHCSTYESLKS